MKVIKIHSTRQDADKERKRLVAQLATLFGKMIELTHELDQLHTQDDFKDE
jgi:hypothetical protein